MRPVVGVALALSALAGCFSDTAPHLTGAGDTADTTTTGPGTTSTSSSTSSSTAASTTSSTSTSSVEPTTAATTAAPLCPMGQVERPWYLDGDGDGYGAGAAVAVACEGPRGAVDVPGDCDDGNFDVSPGAAELCNDLVDDDCDGLRDEYSAENLECGECSLAASDTATFWACSAGLAPLAAEAACQSHGATVHLANPADAPEHALARDLVLQRFPAPPAAVHYWLGIRRPMALWDECTADPLPASWESLDASPITYLPWKAGEPNNYQCDQFCTSDGLADPACRRENCVELVDPVSGSYNDDFCDAPGSNGYVCKAPL